MVAMLVSCPKASADGKYHGRYQNGDMPYLGMNALDQNGYSSLDNAWLDLFKQSGSNYTGSGHTWATCDATSAETTEEAYAASIMDADGYPTTLTVAGIPGGQKFTQLQCAMLSNRIVTNPLPPGATDQNPALALRLRFQGKCTLVLQSSVSLSAVTSNTAGVTISGVAGQTATITSTNAWGTVNEVTFDIAANIGFFHFCIAGLPDSNNYFKAASLVEQQYAALYDSGTTLLHPRFKNAFTNNGGTGFSRLRSMGGFNTNGQEIRLIFNAALAQGNNTGGTLSKVYQNQSSWTVWPFPSATINILFATGQVIPCTFQYNSAAVAWGTALSGAIASTGDGASAPFAMAIGAMKGSAPWANRPLLSNLSWGLPKGLPIEAMLQACNELDAEPWINIPIIDHVLDLTYSTNIAKLCKDGTGAVLTGSNLTSFSGVTTGKRPHIEPGNETWNYSLPYRNGNLLCTMMGVLKGYYAAQGNGEIQAGQEYYGTVTAAIGDAFYSVYGAAMDSGAVLVGVMSQAVVGTLTAIAMNTPDAADRAYTHHIGMKGFAPYIGPSTASAGPNLTTVEWAIIVRCSDPLTELFSLAHSNVGSITNHQYGIPAAGWVGGMVAQVDAILANWVGQPWYHLPTHCYEGGTGSNSTLSNSGAIASISWAGGVATVNTIAAMANVNPGDTFLTTVSGCAPSGYNTPFVTKVTATVVSATQFTYPLATDPGGAATVVGTFPPFPWYETCDLLTSCIRDSRHALVYYDPNHTLSSSDGYCAELIKRNVTFNQLGFISATTAATEFGGGWGGWCTLEIITQMEGVPPTSIVPKYKGMTDFLASGVWP